jgi:hypothetical protein
MKLLPVVQGPVWPDVGESAHRYEFNRGEVLDIGCKWNSRKIVVVVGVIKVELSDGWWGHGGDDISDPVAVQRFACASAHRR